MARVVGLAWAVALVLTAGGPRPADAQDDNGWSVVFTPQVWLSHIPENGFAGPPLGGIIGINGTPSAPNPNLLTVNSEPTAALNPQWGGQLAFQRGLWTFGVAAQYVSFETRNTVTARYGNLPVGNVTVGKGQTVVQEFIDTDRFDLDLTLSYFLPDTIKDVLDINAGVGFKFIYASASRTANNGVADAQGIPTQFTYVICNDDNLPVTGCPQRDRVSLDDYYYGATLPVTFNFHLGESKKWFLPFSVSPFLGAETRYDHNVVYATVGAPGTLLGVKPKRLDGTSFAYGGTADLGVRYIFDNGIALYGGFRVQYLEGLEQYLAWGPMVNMSVRFGK
jgi:hypothetical protein